MSEEQDWTRIGVAAALAKEYAAEGRAFVPVLARLLENALPDLTEPIMSGGFLKKKEAIGVKVDLDEFRYELNGSSGRIQASRTHVVRGISLKSEPISVDQWLAEVGDAVDRHLHGNAEAAAALNRLLGSG